MAEKKPIIVIKKITVVGGGHHGGSWKVALADFMTAMMAFFLVMWLLGQSAETKKAISDYFSTPSIIEYNFENFGAEITLEKLFLDFINEPMKAIQSFLEPIDKTPNILDFGSEKLVKAFLIDQLADTGAQVVTNSSGFQIEIPDDLLFEVGSAATTPDYTKILEKLRRGTEGLQDAQVEVYSEMILQSEPTNDSTKAKRSLAERASLIKTNLMSSLEHPSVKFQTQGLLVDRKGESTRDGTRGRIIIKVKQNDVTSDGKKRRPLQTIYGPSDNQIEVIATPEIARKPSAAPTVKQQLENPLSNELRDINPDLSPFDYENEERATE